MDSEIRPRGDGLLPSSAPDEQGYVKNGSMTWTETNCRSDLPRHTFGIRALGARMRVSPGNGCAPDGFPFAVSAALLLHAPRKRRLANRKLVAASCAGAAVLLVIVVVAGRLLTGAALEADFGAKSLAPTAEHLFGTDWMGRDMFARTLSGLSTSVLIGLLGACTSALMALALAAVAALGGKRADAVVTWLVDLFMGIPHIVLLILVSYAMGKGFVGVTVAVSLTHWPSLTRVLRAEILQCRESAFVEHARKLGQSRVQIALRHFVPYVLPQFIVGLVLLFPHVIMHEAAITFLGFGLPPDIPAVGIILSESMSYLSAGMWWLALFPGLALVLTVMLFDVVGSNARRLLDPHGAQE